MAQRNIYNDDNDDAYTVDSSRYSYDGPRTGERAAALNNGPLGVTGPAGEAGLPPSRPMSWNANNNLMPNPAARHQAQPSTTSSYAGTDNRPSTAGSRAHIPSLTSRAFFAPMTSQQLQAHRGQRHLPNTTELPRESEDWEDDRSQTHTHRSGLGSVLTGRPGYPPGVTQADLDILPPPPQSRGTEISEWSPGEPATTSTQLISNGDKPKNVLDTQQNGGQMTGYRRNLHQPTSGLPRVGTEKSSPTLSQGENRPTSGYRYPGEKASDVLGNNPRQRASTKDLTGASGKNYEYFQGNTIFCFGGRLQNARSRPISIATAILILLPAGLFFGYSAPWLWLHVSPAVPIFFAYLFLICISSFYHASVTDPGVLPRNVHPLPPLDHNADPMALEPPTTDWVMVKSAVAQHGAFEVPTKYCKTCAIWRPPRCHHCRVCDNCVDTQDHHCVWLNNCVGRRNYRYFFAFVASGFFLGVYLFAASIGHVVAYANQNGISVAQSIGINRVPFAMFLYGLIAFCYPTALWGYHNFLILRGQTTREYLQSNKFQKKDRHRPFNQASVLNNLVAVLCRPRPASYLQFKKPHEAGDQRLSESKVSQFKSRKQQRNGGVEMQQFQGPASRAPIGSTNESNGRPAAPQV
ncbi:hypothetical protein FH972_023909 [Carpinus fangiana]|uniref:S-acyltransferase n=1 Tax=Carpinus fangiana TaxID=176857 RepID=A0A5N6KWW2_9ROSI|nr:hypothetical protein FH972_023909 [Carpinus fangiana]